MAVRAFAGVAHGRVTNFRNWVPELVRASPTRSCRSNTGATTTMSLCGGRSDGDLIRRATGEMTTTGLLGGARSDRRTRRAFDALLSGLCPGIQTARAKHHQLSGQAAGPDGNRPLRSVQIQQSGPQYPDGAACGREPARTTKSTTCGASTRTTSRIKSRA